jgi:small subunit ribosomal protein S15
MAVYLTSEKKEEIFKEYGGDTKNTGSTEAQVALFTFRIQKLSEQAPQHFQKGSRDPPQPFSDGW